MLDNNILLDFIKNNYLKNRTIVSKDIPGIFDDIAKIINLEITRHKYNTGEDYSTWIIPPSWDVKQAWLKDQNGNTIASYKDHPLFLCPYSCSIKKKITKAELLTHTISEPNQPDAFAYNWRYALDYNLRLKDWGISLPLDKLKDLEDGPFEIMIDVEVEDGEMLVGEISLPGESNETFIFLSDYCHPGQVNDSFTGLAIFLKLMHFISQIPNRKYTYKMLMLPETIGSAAYITENIESLKNVKGAMFSEMVGWGDKWYLKESREKHTYMNLLARECSRKFSDLELSDFFSLIGNDEYMFDSVQADIPTLSLQKYPYKEYHTSNDDPSHINLDDFQKAYNICCHMIDVIESDERYEFIHAAPFWMTRFNLYSDDQYEPEDYKKRYKIVYQLLDGKNTNLQIADALDCSLEEITDFIDLMEKNNLVKKKSP